MWLSVSQQKSERRTLSSIVNAIRAETYPTVVVYTMQLTHPNASSASASGTFAESLERHLTLKKWRKKADKENHLALSVSRTFGLSILKSLRRVVKKAEVGQK